MVAIAKLADSPPALAGFNDIRKLLTCFEAVSLDDLQAVALQDRIDSKFLFGQESLPEVLAALALHYRVLDIDGVRAHRYQTLYFDTPGFDLYLAQHAGRPDRYKVRSRRYVETQQCFFEVKHKNAKDRTVKQRYLTRGLVIDLDDTASQFVREICSADPASMEPKLWSRYSRITLVSKDETERLTLDLDLTYTEEHQPVGLPGLVVAELKQAVTNRSSPFWHQMRSRHIQPTGFSKYCVGAALLNPQLKRNRFKPGLLRAARISERYRAPQ